MMRIDQARYVLPGIQVPTHTALHTRGLSPDPIPKTAMRPRSASGATDENLEGRQPLVRRVWKHGNLNSVFDSNMIFM